MYATRVSRPIAAPPAVVYRALLDPAAVQRWRVPDDMTSEIHEFEAYEGGTLRVSLTYAAPDRTDTYHGHFASLVPDREVVEVLEFETTDPAMGGTMTITTTLTATPYGCDVTIVHEGLPDAVDPADNETGTRMALASLARYVEPPVIRPGDEGDVPAVLALMDGAVEWLVADGRAGQWGTDPYSASPERVAAITRLIGGGLHVAVSGDRVVGALGVGAALGHVPAADEPELYVRLLVTDRGTAGRGIGALLLDHARTLARADGVHLLRVDCYAGPDRKLVRYYESQGFTATDTFEVSRPSGSWPGQILAQRLP